MSASKRRRRRRLPGAAGRSRGPKAKVYTAVIDRRRLYPGKQPRPARDERTREQILESYRRGARAKGVKLNEVRAHEAVEKLWTMRVRRNTGRFTKRELAEIAAWRVQRVHLNAAMGHPLIAQWALMRSTYMRPVMTELCADPGGPGRDASNRLGACGIARWITEAGPLTLSRAVADFCADLGLVQGAFKYPPAVNPRTGEAYRRSTIMEAIKGRPERGQRGQLDRADPDVIERAAARAFTSLVRMRRDITDPASQRRWPDLTKTLAIDGFLLPISAEQRGAVSRAEHGLLNGRFAVDEAGFAIHDDAWKKAGRGLVAMPLTTVHGPVCSPYVHLRPYDSYEPHWVIEALERYRELVGDEIFLDLEYLVADRLYFDDQLCEDLIFCYGIQPIIPWKEGRSVKWSNNKGTPYCEWHGDPVDMICVRAPRFYNARQRLAMGLAPGDDLREAKPKSQWPHMEFACPIPGCPNHAHTWPHHAASVYALFHHTDAHRPRIGQRRYAFRQWIAAQRNQGECMNAILERMGVGLIGEAVPRAVKTLHEMRWFVAGHNLAHTAKRVQQLNGDIERALAQAEELGYFKPKGRRWYRRTMRRLRATR
jgi:hypothetical protein